MNKKRHPYRLVCFDMDSTLVEEEMLEIVGSYAGKGDEISKATARAMRGESDFSENLARRLSKLRGVGREIIEKALNSMHIVHGVKEVFSMLRREGIETAIIGGLNIFAHPLAEELEANFCICNRLRIAVDGSLAGELDGEALDSKLKQRHLLELCEKLDISPAESVAVGDGANDLGMIKAAGLGVGFNAKSILLPYVDLNICQKSMLPLLSAMGL